MLRSVLNKLYVGIRQKEVVFFFLKVIFILEHFVPTYVCMY
jgi:hypothetical protein